MTGTSVLSSTSFSFPLSFIEPKNAVLYLPVSCKALIKSSDTIIPVLNSLHFPYMRLVVLDNDKTIEDLFGVFLSEVEYNLYAISWYKGNNSDNKNDVFCLKDINASNNKLHS